MLSSVTEMLFADTVPGVDFESALFSPQRQVFPDPNTAVVEEHVVVGAQAQDVVWRVGLTTTRTFEYSPTWQPLP